MFSIKNSELRFYCDAKIGQKKLHQPREACLIGNVEALRT